MKFECDIEKKAEVDRPAYLQVGLSEKTPHVTILTEDVEGAIIVYLNIEDAKQFAYEVLKHKQMLQQIQGHE